MGSDYQWLRLHTGAAATDADVDAALDAAAAFLEQAGYAPAAAPDEPSAATRGLVAFADGPWVQLGDQAGSTEFQRSFQPGAGALAAPLSARGPVVRMLMSDDAILHLELWRDQARVDRHGTMNLDWSLFTAAQGEAFTAHPARWRDLLDDPAASPGLEQAWALSPGRGGLRGRPASEVLATTARALGWDPQLVECGFSHDADGIFIPWDGYHEPEVLARIRPKVRHLAPPA